MATLTFTYTLTNGSTADATHVMANFNAIKTLLETTKLDTANLNCKYVKQNVCVSRGGQMAGGDAERFYFSCPQVLYPLKIMVYADALGGGSTAQVNLRLAATDADIIGGGGSITASVARTVDASTTFAAASYAADTGMYVLITATGAGTVDNVQVTFWFKTELST